MPKILAVLVLVFVLASLAGGTENKLQKFNWEKTKVAEILGQDFMNPEEVASKMGVEYTDEQLQKLWDSLPPDRYLGPMKRSDYILVPAPPNPTSLSKMRDSKLKTEQGEELTTFGWLPIKKMAVQNSLGKPWREQLKLLSSHERPPNAPELWWAVLTYFKVRRIKLFEGYLLRTASLEMDGRHVAIGSIRDPDSKEYVLYAVGVDEKAQVALAAAGK